MDRLALLADEGARFVAAIERGEPGATVPSCPEWTLRELVHHTGGIHRWATRVVSERRAEPIDEELEAIAGGWPADDDLAPWFRAGHTLLVDALRSAPDDLECWAFLRAASPREFWSRRQLHETTIHRVDAELASGGVSEVDVEQAVDGIDELLTAFLPRRSSRLKPETTKTIAVQPTDADSAWLVTAGPEGATTERVRSDADAVVRGTAADLYLLVWNRRSLDGLDVSGDASLLDLWRSSVQVRWS
ncbi:MAG TPA: maleylpyruvate isomerase family mycothiol-dependent enzyme [Acidimicrobiales bacterium]|nr:maleylpyruvate isomerase family mycothiol-dependent enzyme [Acidimicrobiales bacterium]